MKKSRFFSPFVVALSGCVLLEWAIAAPVVSNVTAAQRPGTKLIDIAYDLSAPGDGTVMVSLQISSDAGATWIVPATSATGHLGRFVVPGEARTIVWDAGTDWVGNYSNKMRFRVVADDGFLVIPGGSFTMGRTSGDEDHFALPITTTVSTFYMADTETTKGKWDEVRIWALNNGYNDLAPGAGKAMDHPVQSVSWWDAVKWCNARSEMEGLTAVYTVAGNVMRSGTTEPEVNWSSNGYRLPTEAEWEMAARGGVIGKRFPWGEDEINHDHANYLANSSVYNYDTSPYTSYVHHPTYATGGNPFTSPVGSFAANSFGLWDMSGNVEEWCWDWFNFGYYATSNGTTDPRGPVSGTYRGLRGGGWGNTASLARVSVRASALPSNTSLSTGFRSARSSVQ